MKYNGLTGALVSTLTTFTTSTARDLLVGADGFLYVTEPGTRTLWRVDTNTGARTSFNVMTPANAYPMGASIGIDGHLYLSDNWNNVKQKINASTGASMGTWGTDPTLTNGSYKDLFFLCPCPTITVSPATLTSAATGAAYSQTLSAAGGAGSYTYTVSSGTLPAGLSLNSATGALSGTPTSSATSVFSIRASDPNGCAGTQSYTLTTASPLIEWNLEDTFPSTMGILIPASLARTD
jgi:hypothetical protein